MIYDIHTQACPCRGFVGGRDEDPDDVPGLHVGREFGVAVAVVRVLRRAQLKPGVVVGDEAGRGQLRAPLRLRHRAAGPRPNVGSS